MLLRTNRLQLRPFALEEAEALHALWTHPKVRRFLWDDQCIPRGQTEDLLRRSHELFEQRGLGLWSIRTASAGPLQGFGGYWFFREPPELELLLGLDPACWHQGLATEAGQALIWYGFEVLGFDEIQASTDAPNAASVSLMERLGMIFQRRAVVDGLETLFYILHRSAWKPPRSHRITCSPEEGAST